MNVTRFYPIGTPGQRWGAAEKAEWLSLQVKKRSFFDEVLPRIDRLRDRFDVSDYGRLDYPPEHYPLQVVRSRNWNESLPIAVVTGGVHGYETSGVHGALRFLERHAESYAGRVNLLVIPCVSPWSYERIHRWNPAALDPNRSFKPDSAAPESAAVVKLLTPLVGRVLVHIDLHETTDSDESEFRPALAARDGEAFEAEGIPDGFYLVDDVEHPQPGFQDAIIAAVAKVTHIAPADADGKIIGSPVVAPGVIRYPLHGLGLCSGITRAPYTTTTEVYPDSPRATSEQCNEAQAVAVCAGLDYVLAHPLPLPG